MFDLDISQLQTIIQVAETGSLSRAAERLNIVQPALSRKLSNLEMELGATLFERHGRGMVPTDVGRAILQHAKSVMSELDQIRLITSREAGPLSGKVTVGITPTIAEIVTVPLAEMAKFAHPNLSIRFTSAFSGYLLDWLQRGEIDLALSYDFPETQSIRMRPVMAEELLLIAPQSRFAASGMKVEFADLALERRVFPGNRHGLRKILNKCAMQAGIELVPAIEVDSLNAMIALVRADFGCTILPLPPVYGFVETRSISVASIVEPKPMRTVVTAFSSMRAASPAARFIAEAFSQIVGEMVHQHKWAGRLLTAAAGTNVPAS